MKGGLHVLGGGTDGVGVGLSAQGPHLGLHLWRAAGHTPGADLQVDACKGERSEQ